MLLGRHEGRETELSQSVLLWENYWLLGKFWNNLELVVSWVWSKRVYWGPWSRLYRANRAAASFETPWTRAHHKEWSVKLALPWGVEIRTLWICHSQVCHKSRKGGSTKNSEQCEEKQRGHQQTCNRAWNWWSYWNFLRFCWEYLVGVLVCT